MTTMTMSSLSVADLSAAQSYNMSEQPANHIVPSNDHHSYGYYYPAAHQQSSSAFATHVTSTPTPMQPMPPANHFMASPSKNPCMVRVFGAQGDRHSRYRNDPYTCSVLSQLNPHQQNNNNNYGALTASNLANRRLAPLPHALQAAAKRFPAAPLSSNNNFHPRAKADIARAQEFAQDQPSSISTSPDSMISRHTIPTTTTQHQKSDVPMWAMVRLKHEVLLYNLGFPAKEGDFVVLEGDRGENIGRLSQLVYEYPQHPVQCRVLRVADDRDIEAVRIQREKEEAAKHFAQGVSDALQLGIKVVDTEFQTDGNKLTLYFTSRRQIDFRRLQRQMFKQYRCRIWLVNWADVVKAQ